MKNRTCTHSLAVIGSSFILFTFISIDSFSQGKTKEQTLAAFPDKVSGIFANSCVGCHSDQSKGKAKTFMNLSEWDKLSQKKQHKEGKSIAKIIRKGEMPPRQFLEKRPEAALTTAQVAEINSWAKSVKK